ncbi:MAG: hypothetical protein DRP66_04365 [Planctomycetota bacterium]|nr:MAG: hypothetical protein DRP66_04365 [Planctomycetota bacterium]
MASSVKGIWAIDIGSNALKAIRLVRGDEGLEVVGFDYIEHGRVLSADGIDEEIREHMISETLGRFASRNDVGDEEVAISIAGHNSFARFIKLPPVEKKRVPEIVQFEAVQQIPFDINEVEWDWQIMDDPDSPDTEVGIFAIKNEIINAAMEHFTRENMKVSCVQISPIALYNYALHDLQGIGGYNEKATVIIDMGAENTTLVVCSQTGIWQRSIRIGGNAFSQAIADAFHLSFRKAEKLKRTAPMSKYMRQIFTAMKPVFTDLGSEIQRSLGFYSSSGPGREKGFARVIAFGGGMKLQGLAKYLQQTLNVPVVKPDSFRSLTLNSAVSSAKFHENVSDFGVVYGLGIQLLGEPKIEVNLLPRKMARAMAWRRKGRMFMIAASILLGVSLLGLVRANIDKGKYRSNANLRRTIASVISRGQKAAGDLRAQQARSAPFKEMFKKETAKFDYRDVIPAVNHMVLSCLPNKDNTPEQKSLYEAFESGDVAGVVKYLRGDRKQLFVTGISVTYSSDLENATFDKKRRKEFRRPIARQERTSERGDEGEYDGRGYYGSGGAPIGRPGGDIAGADAEKRGFVVMMEGYSPYKEISALLDPHGVGTDKERWGLVTRLVNISEIIKDCPFELYKKTDLKHFVLESGPVDLRSGETPTGIGVEKEMERVPMQLDTTAVPGRAVAGRYKRPIRNVDMLQQDYVFFETVLIDPMTSEEMGKVYDIVTQDDIDNDPSLSEKDLGRIKRDAFGAPLFIERDYWFRISAKFVWKNAPLLPERPLMYDDPYGMEEDF